ncbi:hypothetical protein JZ751_002161 [Albula glossodonta]|uniref:Microtubule-associated tumor suppressor candidate 2-like n=1 Tax=Albula glossodonta TaxID=121402 RepID=A0A8T2P9N7_9TELE|nr:hypothetical protein JZ751_002161 [Albula glossodonta]
MLIQADSIFMEPVRENQATVVVKMSSQGQPGGSVHSGQPDNQGEMKNNNKQSLFTPDSDADANANEIQTQDGGGTGDAGALPPLVSQTEEQDKIIIWGTDSQCDDPELEEFEMLECQELEAYLVEEGEEYERRDGVSGGCPPDGQPLPYSSRLVLPTMDKDDNQENVGRDGRQSEQDPESTMSLSLGRRERAACQTGVEFSSENDVFMSCLSTMSSLGGSLASALDTTGRTQTTDSRHSLSTPYRTISEDLTLASQSISAVSVKCGIAKEMAGSIHNSGRSASQSSSVDLNLNSAVLSWELNPEAQVEQVELTLKRSPSLDGTGFLINGTGKCQQRYADTADTEHGDRKGCPQMAAGEGDHDEGNKLGREAFSEMLDMKGKPQHTTKATCAEGRRPNAEAQGSRASPTPGMASRKASPKTSGKPTHDVETPDMNSNPKGAQGQPATGEAKPLRKQGSFEHGHSCSPSSLEKKNQLTRKPWGSPTRAVTPPTSKSAGSPRRRPPSSPAKTASARASPQPEYSDGSQGGTGVSKPLGKVCPSSGIPKPILQHPPRPTDKVEPENRSTRSPPPHYPPKPKNVRPKIITYIRKSPQVKPHVPDTSYEVSTLPSRLSPYPSPLAGKDPKTGGHPKASPVLSASNLLYDKYRHEMQKACYYSPGLVVSGIKPPSHTVPPKLGGKSDSFYGELTDKYLQEVGPHEAGGLFRSPRALRPQLGLGAVTRLPSAKNRMLLAGQRSAVSFSHPSQTGSPSTQCYQNPTDVETDLSNLGSFSLLPDQGRTGPEVAPKSLLPKPGQSGLRPPGYSRLPAARLAAFSFVRSASVSSVSSNQSNDSTHSDPCRPTHRECTCCH